MDYRDDCVPRGCKCNIVDQEVSGEIIVDPPDVNGVELIWTDYGGVEPEQRRDYRGRFLPCCEYDFDRWGFSRYPDS